MNEQHFNIHEQDEFQFTPLTRAARYGCLEILKFLKQKGADMNHIACNEQSPLWLAAWNGYRSIVEYLYEEGADVYHENADHIKPIIAAVCQGHVDVLDFLLKFEDDINKINIDGMDLLFIAVQNSHIKTIDYLVAHGIDISKGALWKAVLMDSVILVKTLIEHGASADLRFENQSLLELAKEKSNQEIIDLVQNALEKKPIINSNTFFANTKDADTHTLSDAPKIG